MDYRKTLNKEVFELMMKKALMEKYAEEISSLQSEGETDGHTFPEAFERRVNQAARSIVKRRIIMRIKKAVSILAYIIGLLIVAAAVFVLITNRQYTVEPREMPGATALDGESYIKFADLGTVAFYTYFMHYDDVGAVYPNYGALDIVNYYSVEKDYSGSGTKIDCEIMEKNKKHLVLHYYGVGVTKENFAENVDDTWEINMEDFWNGKYAKPVILEK